MINKKKVINLYKRGHSCREVAKKVGCEKSYVYLIVKEAGVNRSRSRANKLRKNFCLEATKEQRIQQAYNRIIANLPKKYDNI